MKKYLLVFSAVLLGICLSAFTNTDQNVIKKEKLLVQYTYWYNASGGQVGTIFYDGSSTGAKAKNELTSPPCLDGSGPVCLVGSNSTLTQGAGIPGAGTDNYMLRDN